jgi:hypothetical protein
MNWTTNFTDNIYNFHPSTVHMLSSHLHIGAIENFHITPPAHDAQQPPSTSRHRSAPAPARPPVHHRGV